MLLRRIIIKIDNQNIYFNKDLSILVNQTNLPINHMTFRYNEDVYWKIELLDYTEETKSWHVKVLEYEVEDIRTFEKQKSTKPIERVYFAKLDWLRLESQLSYYQLINLTNFIYNYEPKDYRYFKPVTFNQSTYHIPQDIQPPKNQPFERHPIESGPKIEKLKFEFAIRFQEATFIDGFVIFKKYIQKLGDKIEFKIQNDNILGEFDNIKIWFAKKLKSKKFNVSVTITLVDNSLSEAIAISPQIEMISLDIIESVKHSRIIALTRPPKISSGNKSLYTAEDIFEQIDSELKGGNVFNQSESEIIKSLTQTEFVRNRKQLEYLAENKQSTRSKIHFTLSPLFGFVFLIETNIKYHFVWELLKTHATYLWTINKNGKNVDALYSKIEQYINKIKNIGREDYRKLYFNNITEEGFTFTAIDHQDITANLDFGFSKWKNRLDNYLH